MIDPKLYRKYICKDRRGKPILYIELYKSLYGLMRSALLFYKKLKKELESYGKTMNPYDMCVANKETKNRHQLTVLWHVDDLKISCRDKYEVMKLICYLQRIYGEKMTVHRGGKGKYLGMYLDFTEEGVLQVDMSKYIEGMIDEFPEAIEKASSTPHSDSLFTVEEEDTAKLLGEDGAIQFHRTTAQLLFLCPRARKDIQTAVSFLTTQVKQPTEQDWSKLRRVLQYLHGTRWLKLRIQVNDLRVMHWFIDAAHMVHWDCKGQTGAAMTMDRGAILSYSWKQKLNTKSSTETELIGVDDAISNILWSLYFLQEQGCGTTHAVIYQDNKSMILLETNGRMSSGKRTKHIKAKYFFVADKVANGKVVVKHVPTDKMWADVNTKPKQGLGFRVNCSQLMNCDMDLQECQRQDVVDKDVVSQMRTPRPKYFDKPVLQNASDNRAHHISWADTQECVESARQLGGKNSWSKVTSLVRGASKRLLL
jgi:hypothetical protein